MVGRGKRTLGLQTSRTLHGAASDFVPSITFVELRGPGRYTGINVEPHCLYGATRLQCEGQYRMCGGEHTIDHFGEVIIGGDQNRGSDLNG